MQHVKRFVLSAMLVLIIVGTIMMIMKMMAKAADDVPMAPAGMISVEDGQQMYDIGQPVVPVVLNGSLVGWVTAQQAQAYNACAGGTTNLSDVETQQHVDIPLEAITFWQASRPCLFDPHVLTGGSGKVTDFGGVWFNRSYCSAVPTNDWSCTVLVSDQTARFNPLTIYVASPAVETYTVTLSLERADLTDNATIDVKKWTTPYALYLPNIQKFSNSFSSAANLTTTLVVTQ